MHHHTEDVTLLLAVGPAFLREGLAKLLAKEQFLRVVGSAGSGPDAVRMTNLKRPSIAILDLGIPGISGAEFVRTMSAVDGDVRILLLATIEDVNQILESFHLGARGVVLKQSATDTLVQGILALHGGKYWVVDKSVSQPDEELEKLKNSPNTNSNGRHFGLTQRELQIIAAILTGRSNKEIAATMRISQDTVKHHLTNIFDKLGVYNRLELALFAMHHGLLGRK